MFIFRQLHCTHFSSPNPPNSHQILSYAQDAASSNEGQTTGFTLILFLHSLTTAPHKTQIPSFIHKSPRVVLRLRAAGLVKIWTRGSNVCLYWVDTIHLQDKQFQPGAQIAFNQTRHQMLSMIPTPSPALTEPQPFSPSKRNPLVHQLPTVLPSPLVPLGTSSQDSFRGLFCSHFLGPHYPHKWKSKLHVIGNLPNPTASLTTSQPDRVTTTQLCMKFNL